MYSKALGLGQWTSKGILSPRPGKTDFAARSPSRCRCEARRHAGCGSDHRHLSTIAGDGGRDAERGSAGVPEALGAARHAGGACSGGGPSRPLRPPSRAYDDVRGLSRRGIAALMLPVDRARPCPAQSNQDANDAAGSRGEQARRSLRDQQARQAALASRPHLPPHCPLSLWVHADGHRPRGGPLAIVAVRCRPRHARRR